MGSTNPRTYWCEACQVDVDPDSGITHCHFDLFDDEIKETS